ncbi:MAG: T9SS type A sorting domain-containing protein [Candidatus Cloacimonetes bacterium]|nr:T9SS type A sorting domain-containing protein [Candidatus Cloacimonadota bacterium]
MNLFRKKIFSILIAIIFALPIMLWTKTQNIPVLKKVDSCIIEHFQKIKRLPEIYRDKFQTYKRTKKVLRKDSDEYEVNLLMLLVDFIPDDDPKTTGNGKFDFAEYDFFEVEGVKDSIQTIGSPPHDSTYFHQCIVAMQYYYQTASLGVLNSFDPFSEVNFHFEIFPQQADTAYHLPHKMSYYNPDTEDWDLKTERFIEFFKDAIISADTTDFLPSTPDIDFSQYNHIMIIHAGSDWQHDVFWDTPCDIPAMYIHLEDDSIAVNDSTFIKSASICPETISQDFYKSGHYLYGFGALNPVMFHEFGHSLGFVDLYNTSNMFPAVGWWDIMDCGGMTAGVFQDTTSIVPNIVIEGVIPILPSAWSRILIWGDEFKKLERKRYIELINPTEISISAAEFPNLNNLSNPQFINIPINDKEYFLIENRVIDLDGDKITGVKVDDVTGRVPLYPADTTNWLPNYEYDYMLPNYDIYLSEKWDQPILTNGGLCIWHIDNSVIYDETVIIEGKSYNRFDANMVNANYDRRGVKLIEADGIEDIGNPYSNYAAGTLYEPFFRIKPGPWTPTDPNRFHNYHFGPTTNPNSYSNDGINSLIEILDISNYGTTMSFKFQHQLYGDIISFTPQNKYKPQNEILFYQDYTNNLVITSDSMLTIYNELYDLFGEFNYCFNKKISQPLSLLNFQNDKFIIAALEDSVALVNFNIYHHPHFSSFGTYSHNKDKISDSPIAITKNKILVPTDTLLTIYKIVNNDLFLCEEDTIARANKPKIAYNNSIQKIVVLNHPDEIAILDTNLSLISKFNIQSNLGNFYPIIENRDSTQIIYFQDEIGSIYKVEEDISKIFAGENYSFNKISNISLGDINNDGLHDIVFSADNKLYALQANGAYVNKFPLTPYSVNYSSSVSPIIGKSLLPENISLFLPTESNWTQAISEDCEIVPEYSFSLGYSNSSPYINRGYDLTYIYFPVSDSIVKIFSFNNEAVSESEVYWNGYKNGPERWSFVDKVSEGHPDTTSFLEIIAYPNPAEKGNVRIRINSPEDTHSSIHIYNLTAKLLFQDVQEIKPDINNEYVWNIDKISSGIYFAIVKVGNVNKLLKIGVVK